jgi:thioredoxin 1
MAMNHAYAEVEPARAEIDALPGPALLEFGSVSCGYCIRAQSLLTAAFATHPDVRHVKVEDGSGRPLGRSFAVRQWPTLIFLRDGKEVARLIRPSRAQEVSEAFDRIDPKS